MQNRAFFGRNFQCAFSVPHVRARRKRSALTHSKGFRRLAMHSCAFGDAFAGVGCVPRAETAPKIVEHFAIQPKLTVFECKISRQKSSLSSRKPVNLQHRASNDRRCLSCASCACRWPATALICKVMHAESREFRSQNFAISVPSVRAGRTRSAQTHPKHF